MDGGRKKCSRWIHSRSNVSNKAGVEKTCVQSPSVTVRRIFQLCTDAPCVSSVRLIREAGQSLGISIMGGRGMGRRLSSGEMMRGVFIKHISPDSPAAHNGTLRTGDRILEVCVCVCIVETHLLECLSGREVVLHKQNC